MKGFLSPAKGKHWCVKDKSEVLYFIFLYTISEDSHQCLRESNSVLESVQVSVLTWRKHMWLRVNMGADLLSSLRLSDDEAVAWAVSR